MTHPTRNACVRPRRLALSLPALLVAFAAACGPGTEPCAVRSVSITGARSSMMQGETQQLGTTADAPFCKPVPSASWSSNPASVATVSSSGLVTAVGPGFAVISATAGGATDTAQLLVTPPTASNVIVSPDTVRLLRFDSLVANAVATLSNGQPAPDPITWTSSNPSVASVNNAGLVVAGSIGTAVLTARAGSATGTARIEVGAGFASKVGRVAGPTTFTVTSTEAEIASGTIRLVRANSSVSFAPGDVLVGTEAGGYLRKIVSVNINGNVVTATTTEADLLEAFDAGSIVFEEDLDFATGTPVDLGPGIGQNAGIKGMTVGRDGIVHFNQSQIPFNVEVAAGAIGFPAQIVVNLTGNLEFMSNRTQTGAPTFSIKDTWGRAKSFPWLPEIKSFELTLTSGVKLDATVTASITGAIPTKGTRVPRGEKTLLSRVLTKGPNGVTCSVFGPIPVCYRITAMLVAFVEPEGGPRATITQEMHVTAGATAGLKYSGGQLGPVFTPFKTANIPAAVISLEGDVGVKFGVEPRLLVSLYGLAGPELGIPLGLQLTAGATNNYLWYLQPAVFADVAVGLQAKLFGKTLRGSWSSNLITDSLTRITWPAATLSLSPSTLALAPGQTDLLIATARSVPGQVNLGSPSNLQWTSSNPSVALVNSAGLVTAISPGASVIRSVIANTSISAQATVTVSGTPSAGFSVASTAPAEAVGNVTIETQIAVTFSQPVDASTVNANSFRVAISNNPVAGTYSVSGNTVTFTPSAFFSEVQRVTYTMSTALKSTSGAALAAPYTGWFEVAYLDHNYYYRVVNRTGAIDRSLDLNANGEAILATTSNSVSQKWYFSRQGDYFLLRNATKGDGWYLDGMDGVGPALMKSAPPTPTLGQRWNWGGNSAPFANYCIWLFNQQTIYTKSLTNVNNFATMQPTAPTIPQCFAWIRGSRR